MLWAGVFFFSPSILWFSHTGDHPDDELAKFGYRSERKAEKENPQLHPLFGPRSHLLFGPWWIFTHPTESVNILYVPPIKFKHEKLDNIK